MKFIKKLFGPKCYLCYMIISVWAIIQLICTGAFMWIHAVALLEDIPVHHEYDSAKKFYKDAEIGYRKSAINCFVSAGLYVITLFVSGFLFFRKTRARVKNSQIRSDSSKNIQVETSEGRRA